MFLGGKLLAHHVDKKVSYVRCIECDKLINGLPIVRARKLKNMAKNKKTISRPYGGTLCPQCLKNRYQLIFNN